MAAPSAWKDPAREGILSLCGRQFCFAPIELGLTTTVSPHEKDGTRERTQSRASEQGPQHHAKRQYQSVDQAVVGDRGLIVFARDAHPVARDGDNRGEP